MCTCCGGGSRVFIQAAGGGPGRAVHRQGLCPGAQNTPRPQQLPVFSYLTVLHFSYLGVRRYRYAGGSAGWGCGGGDLFQRPQLIRGAAARGTERGPERSAGTRIAPGVFSGGTLQCRCPLRREHGRPRTSRLGCREDT